MLSDWLTSRTLCCLLSLASSFLENPVLDIFVDSDSDVDLGFFRKLDKPYFLTQLPSPNSDEETFVPLRNAVTDTIFFTSSLPSLYFTGNHGKIALFTDNISTANILWTKHRLLEGTIIFINSSQIGAYTWFPYRSDQCHREPDLDYLGSCNKNCTWNTDLYPRKLPKHFDGCPLRFACYHYPPNVYQNSDGTFRGREVDFMEALAMSYGFSIRYIAADAFFASIGEGGKPIGAMGALLRGKADFAYSTLATQEAYSQFGQALPSYREGLVVWMLPTPKPKPIISNVFSGFSSIIWYFILSTTLIVMATVGFLAHVKCDRWLWIDIIAVTIASPITTMSKSWLIRLLLVCTQLYCLHIAWFYQMTLLGNLFSKPMEKQLLTAAEAVDAGLVALLRGYLVNIFNGTDHQLWKKMLAKGGSIISSKFDYSLVVEQKSAFMMTIKVNDEVNLRKAYPHLSLSEMVYTVKEPVANYPISAYGRRGCSLTNLFARQTAHLIESGLFEHWTRREPDFKPISAFKRKTNAPITLEMLQAVFYLLFGLLFVSCIVFIVELFNMLRPRPIYKKK